MGRHDRKRPGSTSTAANRTQPIVTSPDQQRVLEQLQARFGNQVVERLLLNAPASPFEAYLADLLAAEHATDQDFSAYLPGRAPQEWTRFAQAWYRVLWEERAAGPVTGLDVDAAPALDAPDPGLATAATANAPIAQATPTAQPAAEPVAQRKASADTGPDFGDSAELTAWFTELTARSSGGRPLSEAEQAFLSRIHGRRIHEARVHEGAGPQDAAREIDARAFTVGTDIWVGDSVDLRSREGAALLAHEATHVLQNAAGRGATGSTRVSEPGQPLELEAEAAERAASQLWSERREAWGFTPPAGLDSRAEFLADWMLGQLPATAGQAPDALVREGLRSLLAQRAHQRLGDARLTLQSGLATDVAAADESSVSRQLSALAKQAAAAGSDRDGLLLLLQIAGAPTAADLAAVQDAFAPYPGFADQLAAALSALTGTDPVAQAVAPDATGGLDLDPDRGQATLALVRQLAPQLGLSASSVDVHTDSAAADKTHEAGTRGLAEGSSIYLDTDAFQAGTADARGLVAHELTHVAQEGLDPAPHSNAGWFAEAEAAETAWRAASGGSISAPEFGLPTGHVAAEGGPVGGDMLGPVAAIKEGVTTTSSSAAATVTTKPGGGQDPNASEDSDKKLEQFEDGVDGICDLIGDLDAFDDLCEAIDDDEPTAGPLSRVKSNEHYSRLPKMWQGAKEGGEVSGQMMSSFNDEFDGRGFWEETELAFDMICRHAKAEAKPEPEAAAAKANLQTADGANAEREAGDKGSEGAEGGEGAAGAEIAPVDPALAALMAADVPTTAPEMGEFTGFSAISDEQFQAISDATTARAAFCANPPDIEQGRGGQVMEAMFENLIGSGTAAFTDQLVDGLVWDNVGKLGDLAMRGLTKGKLGTPFVGPIIQLAQNPPWTAAAWGGEQFSSLGDGWNNLGNTLDAFNQAEDAGDYLGLCLAVFADVLGMVRDLVDAICTILSTLSALCYVVGGLLIIFGIALLWLAGVGAPLVSAGGWLTRMGGILGRINTVLEPVVILLSGLVMMFRTAAALLVPSELYAQQLQGVGEDASTFGEKGGAKLGDKAAEGLNNAAAAVIEPRNTSADNMDSQAAPEGDDLSTMVDESNRQDADRIAQDAQDAIADGEPTRLEDDAAPAQDDDATPAQDDDAAKPDDDDAARPDDDATPGRGRRMLSFLGKVSGVTNAVDGVKHGLNDAMGGFTDPARFAQEGLNPQLRAYVDGKGNEAIQKLGSEMDRLKAEIKAIEDGTDTDSNMYDEERLHQELITTRDKVVELHGDLESRRQLIADIERQERAAQSGEVDEDRKTEDDNAVREREAAAEQRIQDLETERARVETDLETKQTELGTAEQGLTDARDAAQGDILAENQRRDQEQGQAMLEHADDVRAHQQDVQDRGNERARQESEMDRLNTKANDLTDQARATDEARPLQTAADTAKDTADTARADLMGGRISVKIDGTTRTRTVTDVSVDAGGNVTLTVEKTRGAPNPTQVGVGDITNDRQQRVAQELGPAQLEADTKQAAVDALLAPWGGENRDPATLRQESTDARDQAQQERMNWEAGNTPMPAGPTAPTRDNSPIPDGDAVVAAQGELDKVKGEISALETRQGAIPGELSQAQREAAIAGGNSQTRSIARHQDHVQRYRREDVTKRVSGRERVADGLRSTSSGNAMGGTGSAYQDLGQSFARWIGVVDGAMSGLPTNIRMSRHMQQIEQSGNATLGTAVEGYAQQGLDAAFGLGQRETKEELNAIGAQQATVEQSRQTAVEALLNCEPTVDYEEFAQHRTNATQAHEEYIRHHALAFRAFTAENMVSQLAVETQELADQGKPIQSASQSMEGPMQSSVATEGQRGSVLSGQSSEVPAADSSMGGIVVELIAKLADNSDAMDDQPDGGDSGSGAAMADGQTTAKDQASERTEQGQEFSQKNREFLDTALTARAAQEESVATNITSLEGRATEELAIRDEIRGRKAQHLMDMETARVRCVDNSTAFTTEYATMDAWRQDWDTKKAAVDAAF